jgi:hypothetical protein
MNPYPELSNTSKARILCRLFPAEIQAVLQFIEQRTTVLLANPPYFRPQHDERLFSFERLLALAQEVQSCLRKGKHKDPASLFTWLFEGYRACYTAQLLIRFSAEINPEHESFATAVRLLFMV